MKKTACGTDTTGEISTKYRGKVIYFCEEECLEEFTENPEVFLNSDHFKLTFDMLPEEK